MVTKRTTYKALAMLVLMFVNGAINPAANAFENEPGAGRKISVQVNMKLNKRVER